MIQFTTLFPLLASLLLWSVKAGPCLHKTEEAPKLTLPWGTWLGTRYGEYEEVYVFKNVRFGRAPVGGLRFAAPQYPAAIEDNNQIQNSSYGPNCIQAAAKVDVSPEPHGTGTEDEDCLFLDVYVPSWALEEPEADKLPVIVWIYGGAYIFGGKELDLKLRDDTFPAYDGKGYRDATDNGVIWVTGNYRLGAYGFLAGSSMEQDGQPNAGLHDQRLLLDWVQKYIGQVGGDKNAVNVWGLSAGAGSILHHLTAYGGQKAEALFHRASMWSTAFQWAYDRKGSLQQTFLNFTKEAKCGSDASAALSCLRKASPEALKIANQIIVSQALALGMFPFGPAVDGDMVPELPAALLKQGKHVNCSSIILSHDYDEANLFLADWVETKEDFTRFVSLAFPGSQLAGLRKDIEVKYPPIAFDNKQKQRLRKVLRDSTFVCNKRQIYDAFKNTSQVYAARYEIPPAQHGVDLLAIVWNRDVDVSDLVKAFLPKLPDWIANLLETVWTPLAIQYQRYFAGHALSGNPNHLNDGRGLDWEVTTDDGNELTNSLKIGLMYLDRSHPFFALGSDLQSSEDNCDFWNDAAAKISSVYGKDMMLDDEIASFRVQRPDDL